MNITEILKPVDNLFIYVNENKNVLLLVLVLLGIYITQFNEYIIKNSSFLFDNNLFKLIIFIVITYIGGSSPSIGISLAILMLVSMQIITNLKINNDLKSVNPIEKFNQIEPVDISYLNDEYLTNPLEMQKDLSPSVDLDLKLTTPTDYYLQMIKKGKVLLDDSYDLEQDLSKRFDIREKQIASITKRNGIELVDSGINRLQKSDQGEYNIGTNIISNTNNTESKKFIKYSKLLENISSNHSVKASYNDLLYNYNKLISSQLDEKSFDAQLNKVYLSELELLETIYRVKKNTIPEQKQKLIEDEFNKIKQSKSENKDWFNGLKPLSTIL